MSQEKAKIHSLRAVPNTTQDVLFEERDFYATPADASRLAEENEPKICPLCYGSGMEVVAGKGARQCSCRKKKSKDANLLEKANIPRRYEDKHFQNYIITHPSQDRAQNLATTFAMKFCKAKDENKPENMPKQGLLFIGSVGVGKTHLAVSILKMILERGHSGLFYEFGSLLKVIQDSYNANTQSSELKILAPVFDAEVLVLDEIGASKPTDWVQDTMAHIINTRYNDKKLTIFTTNYLDKRQAEREEILEDRIGVRLRSRLCEMCKTVQLAGEDFRRTFDQVTQIKKNQK